MTSNVSSYIDSNDCLSYEDLLNIVRNGLPKTTSKKKIIVVGAGMAGLSAAYVLHKAGHEVTILEASDRVGGRVMTYRDKAGWQVELGAMRIPEEHKIILYLINNVFQLELDEFVGHDPETYYYIDGIRQKMKDFEKNPESFGFDLCEDEKGKSGLELWNKAINPYLQELHDQGYRRFSEKYGHYSTGAFLQRKTNLSRSAISLIRKLDNMEKKMKFSFPVTLACYYQRNTDTKFFRLPGGTDQLPKSFQAELKDFLYLKSKVVKIRQNSVGVVAEVGTEGNPERVCVQGDYLVMCTSAAIVAVTEFDPPLSIGKQDAMRMVDHDCATKIALGFSVRFWEDEGIRGGASVTDLPARQFYYFPGNSTFAGGVVLSYTRSRDSQRLTGMNEKECLRIALNNLVEIHGEHIREHYLGGVVKHWFLDPFAFGAWVSPIAGEHLKFLNAMNKEEGRVWFAGEYTEVPISWMENAVKSGLRAAHAIHTKSLEEVKCKR